ncbi:hypothetical protein ACQEVF_56520 [Nonomuraea polychroma]|uniref:hypothetical protein n=1 Tax=Nonomuraea polychroma TaxID=46176 RepID=UPI003D8D6ECE
MWRKLDKLTLFDGQRLRERLRDGSSHLLDELPAELVDARSPVSFATLPDGSDVVLARVDLGEGVFPDAVQVARERVHALVGLARFRTSSTTWKPLEGYLHAVNGWVNSIGRFRPREMDRGRPVVNPVGRALVDLTPRLWDKLAHADKELRETVGAVDWWQEAQQQQQPLSALILNVRVLEVTATRVAAPDWCAYLDTYLASSWMQAAMYTSLFQAIQDAFADEGFAALDHHDELRSLQQAIETGDASDMVNFDGVAAVEALPRLVEIYPLHTRTGRRLRQLTVRLSSPAAVADWCDEMASRWERALSRLRRSRNAIAHGGPVTRDAIATLDDFGRYLSAWSLSLLLDGSDTFTDITKPHEDFRDQLDEWRRNLRSASDARTALFADV